MWTIRFSFLTKTDFDSLPNHQRANLKLATICVDSFRPRIPPPLMHQLTLDRPLEVHLASTSTCSKLLLSRLFSSLALSTHASSRLLALAAPSFAYSTPSIRCSTPQRPPWSSARDATRQPLLSSALQRRRTLFGATGLASLKKAA